MDPLSALRQQKSEEARKPERSAASLPDSLFAAGSVLSSTATSGYPGVSTAAAGAFGKESVTRAETVTRAASSTTSDVVTAPSSLFGNEGAANATPASNGLSVFSDMLAGERVVEQVKVCHLLISNPFCEIAGRLLVTPYRLKFVTPKGTLRKDLEWMKAVNFFDVPFGVVEDIKDEKSTTGTGALELKVTIQTKDLRTMVFIVGTERDVRNIRESVAAFGTPGNPAMLFAFKHFDELNRQHASQDLGAGWDIYDPLQEYARMGVETELVPNDRCPWRLSIINREYGLCASYPSLLALPRRMPDQALRAVAGFRKRGRLPALSWCGGSELCYASLWRCSQTTEGLMGQKCAEDEAMIRAIRQGSGSQDRDLLVIDLRPRTSAWANKAVGGGFEAYPHCRVEFGHIENIHHVKSAWRAMAAAVNKIVEGEVGSWMKDVANSCWYDLIGAILTSTLKVVKEILHFKANVMVHCSDGWDRTAQATSLAMLCLDPHYRTQSGFLKLVQKEWCSFGHRFRTRLALGEQASSEWSPIFIQWLECVWQLLAQYPSAFEFTSNVLLELEKEVFSNRFGTFLCDNEQERLQKVRSHTLSLWSALLKPDKISGWRNLGYMETRAPLIPSPCQANYITWEAYWFRYHVLGSRTAATQETPPLPSTLSGESDPFAPSFGLGTSAPGSSYSGTFSSGHALDTSSAPVVPAAPTANADVNAAPVSLFSPEEVAAPKRPQTVQLFADDDDEDVFSKPKVPSKVS
eukprot:TRINITY_DN41035_c0_g1_i1.p1 TRINITY_DN41035_c0_g1~~TRINITY_DN41035_c0_g1_i1.p1  ORF type:complete len:749 (+),score=147.60 TRINITY_DN41035_c0_g1_i1:43-2289(+)